MNKLEKIKEKINIEMDKLHLVEDMETRGRLEALKDVKDIINSELKEDKK